MLSYFGFQSKNKRDDHMITYDMLCIVYNCLWESAKTRSFKTRKEWGYRWDAFKSAGNGILSLRQELLVVQNGKRQLVLYLYIIYDSINKDCIPLENTSRTSGINVKSKSVKPTLRKLCTHLFDDLPSHFCLKNVFGNILNRGQRVRQLKTMRKVFTLVRGPPLKVQSEDGCCNICFHLCLD